jgi:hypothetical protein
VVRREEMWWLLPIIIIKRQSSNSHILEMASGQTTGHNRTLSIFGLWFLFFGSNRRYGDHSGFCPCSICLSASIQATRRLIIYIFLKARACHFAPEKYSFIHLDKAGRTCTGRQETGKDPSQSKKNLPWKQ